MSPNLIVRSRPETGTMGVYANDWIAPGELISMWGGNILSSADLAKIPHTEQCYAVQVEEDLYLTTLSAPETADFINHSCDANVGMRDAITMVAMRLIAPNEEVCFDYAMTDGSPIDEFRCACGTALCRTYVTGNDWQRPDLWERYAGYFSPYLARRIEWLKRMRKTAVFP